MDLHAQNFDPESGRRDIQLLYSQRFFPVQTFSLRGKDLLFADNLDRAEAILQKGKSRFATDYRILALLGETYIRQGRPELAIEPLVESLHHGPGAAQAYYLLGLAQIELSYFDQAKRNLQTSIHISQLDTKDDSYAWHGLLKAYAALTNIFLIHGQNDGAMSIVESLNSQGQKNSTITLARARALICDRKYQAGEETIVSIIGKHPDTLESHMHLALLYIITNKLDLAREMVNEIKRRRPLDRSVNLAHAGIESEPKNLEATFEGAKYLMLHRYPPAEMERLVDYPRRQSAESGPAVT